MVDDDDCGGGRCSEEADGDGGSGASVAAMIVSMVGKIGDMGIWSFCLFWNI